MTHAPFSSADPRKQIPFRKITPGQFDKNGNRRPTPAPILKSTLGLCLIFAEINPSLARTSKENQ